MHTVGSIVKAFTIFFFFVLFDMPVYSFWKDMSYHPIPFVFPSISDYV